MLEEFGHGLSGGETSAMIKPERCRPDYEKMISNLKLKQKRTSNLLNALMEYSEGRTAKGKMAELIGELVTEDNKLAREVNMILEEMEKSNESTKE